MKMPQPLSPSTLSLNGAELLADLSGALVWPAQRTLVVADLHLEKGSALARSGSLLPPYDTRATLATLTDLLARHCPERVICLGDSFHDPQAADRLAPRDRATLRRLTGSRDWVWICGNHDPAPPAELGGRFAEEEKIGPLLFRHQAAPDSVTGEVSGHFHPKISLSVRGKRVGGRCFVGNARRLILPAFGAYAGGLDVRDPAIACLFADGFSVHLLGRAKLHSFRVR
ncbi:ligase-associated DNA damage response endonuclease PdeM [Virgifigura deserti]|uniref:ligase-associated DNA damage response endonuclease PdeM n=1 Tax=Virgifigura deserti TaxID=2268457 RepID=UPI003CCBB54D